MQEKKNIDNHASPPFFGLGRTIGGVFNFTGNGLSSVLLTADALNKLPAAFIVFSPPKGQKNINPLNLNGINGLQVLDTRADDLVFSATDAGDFDGNGISDLLFANVADESPGNLGTTYLVLNPVGKFFPALLDLAKLNRKDGIIFLSNKDDSEFGNLITSGNFNHIEYSTLMFFSSRFSIAPKWHGRASFVFGGPDSQNYPSPFNVNDLNGKNGYNLEFTRNTSLYPTPCDLQRVSNIGDINGDGFDDIGVTSNCNTFILFGGKNSFSAIEYLDDLMNQKMGFVIPQLPTSIDSAGDFNQDGIQDFIACNTSANGQGICWLVFGRSSFPSIMNLTATEGVISFTSGKGADNFGLTAGQFFNLHHQKYSDIYMSAPGPFAKGEVGKGILYVIFSNSNLSSKLCYNVDDLISQGQGFKVVDSTGSTCALGVSAAGLDDINGDGIPDFAVTAPLTRSNDFPVGKAFIFYGNPADTSSIRDVNQLDGTNGCTVSPTQSMGNSEDSPIYSNGEVIHYPSIENNVIHTLSTRGPSATRTATAFKAISTASKAVKNVVASIKSMFSSSKNTAEQTDELDQSSAFENKKPSQFFTKWEPTSKFDAITGEPIYTFNFHKGSENAPDLATNVGSVSFYGMKGLCRSEDGTQHNVVGCTGMGEAFLKGLQIKEITVICDRLPSSPPATEALAENAAQNDCVRTVTGDIAKAVNRGVTNGIQNAMIREGYTHKTAAATSNFLYYSTYFLACANHHCQTKIPFSDADNDWQIFTLAAQDTLTLFLSNCAMEVASYGCHKLSQVVEPYNRCLSRTLGFFGNIIPYAPLPIKGYLAPNKNNFFLSAGASYIMAEKARQIVEDTHAHFRTHLKSS